MYFDLQVDIPLLFEAHAVVPSGKHNKEELEHLCSISKLENLKKLPTIDIKPVL